MDIKSFLEGIRQDILSNWIEDSSESFTEEEFTKVFADYVREAGGIEDIQPCFATQKGWKINGYSFSMDGECLDLIVTDYYGDTEPRTIPKSRIEGQFELLRTFYTKSVSGFHERLEEASSGYTVARDIYSAKDTFSKLRLYCFTDAIARNYDIEKIQLPKIDTEYHIWDSEKVFRAYSSGFRPEPIDIDFQKDFGEIKCLEHGDIEKEYSSFLAYFPGDILARIYENFGPRLLERNVRSFLQVRGKINKGIRETILKHPNRFLAYNNGISVTAKDVSIEKENGHCLLKKATDFQIVNGGQTTASIFHAYKKDKADLSALTVQVKITVVKDQDRVEEFVPYISMYANSQNKVNAADFSANEPYHVELEKLSRSIYANSRVGTEMMTHWYYERARGQYMDEKGRARTPALIKAFMNANPTKQKFTKTDLAKFENSWQLLPHYVSRGAEKNFQEFTVRLKEHGYPQVDETYFKKLVAKAILFKETERIVTSENFSGYRANIVAYTVAWLAYKTGQRIDVGSIWKDQAITKTLEDSIRIVCRVAKDHIFNTPNPDGNPGEWSKTAKCWEAFKSTTIPLPDSLNHELLQERPDFGQSDQVATIPVTEMEDVEWILTTSPGLWGELSGWAGVTGNFQSWQRQLAYNMGKIIRRGQTPTVKQAKQARIIYTKAIEMGFSPK